MPYYQLQQQIYENKIRRNFNTTDVGKEIVLMCEEYGELCEASINNDRIEMVDALGDLMTYGLGLCSMFDLDPNNIMNRTVKYEKIPTGVLEYLPYVGRSVGRIAKTYKKSNKRLLPELDSKEKFSEQLWDLLGYCANALDSMGENPVSVLENIIRNNITRTHTGQL